MRITKGTRFRTIQEAMQTMFNRNTGSGPKPSYYEFNKSGRAVWFPKAAIPGKDSLLAPRKGRPLRSRPGGNARRPLRPQSTPLPLIEQPGVD